MNFECLNLDDTEMLDDGCDMLHQFFDDQKITELQNTSINLAIDQIERHSLSLNITQNPLFWSTADVGQWLAHLFGVNIWELSNGCHLNGMKLCHLTVEDCRRLFGSKGESIYSELDIWKEVSSNFLYTTTQPEYHNLENAFSESCQKNYDDKVCESYCSSDSEDSGIDGFNHNFDTCLPSEISYDEESPPQDIYKNYVKIDNDNANDQNQLITELLGLPSTFFQTQKLEKKKYAKSGREKYKTRPQSSHLWYFIKQLLDQPETYGAYLRWLDREKAVFRIYNSFEVARLWGLRKNRPAMNYDKLSRSLRQYYKKGIMTKTKRSQRLVYQFCGKYAA